MTDEASDKRFSGMHSSPAGIEKETGIDMVEVWNNVSYVLRRRLADDLRLDQQLGESLESIDGQVVVEQLMAKAATAYLTFEREVEKAMVKILDNRERGMYHFGPKQEPPTFGPHTFVTMANRACVNGKCRGVTVHESTDTTCVIWQVACLRHKGDQSWLVKTEKLAKWLDTTNPHRPSDPAERAVHALEEASKAMQIATQWKAKHDGETDQGLNILD